MLGVESCFMKLSEAYESTWHKSPAGRNQLPQNTNSITAAYAVTGQWFYRPPNRRCPCWIWSGYGVPHILYQEV